MKQTTIPIKADARVVVRCNGDLSVEGIESSTLIVVVDQGDTLRMKEDSNVYRISADSDCRVLLPDTATVTIEKVGGDANISKMKNRVVVGKVGGDLNVSKCGAASIESVGGDCNVEGLAGGIELARIGDSLYIDGILELQAASVGCDVSVKNITGKIDVSAGDDVQISTAVSRVPQMRVRAGSDIHLIVPADASCQLELISGGEDISVHAGGQDVEVEEGRLVIPLGEGGETIVLTAGDSITVSDKQDTDWDEIPRDFDMEDHWKDFGIQIEQRVKESMQLAADSMERAARQAEFAGKHAGREVERVMRNLNERGFTAGRPRKVVGFTFNDNPIPAAPPKNGPSDEERMIVLRMLQDKKITVEEAEKLLNALDR